jgi:hypothetical protein
LYQVAIGSLATDPNLPRSTASSHIFAEVLVELLMADTRQQSRVVDLYPFKGRTGRTAPSRTGACWEDDF